MKNFARFAAVFIVLLLSACSIKRPGEAPKIAPLADRDPQAQIIELNIPRKDFLTALQNSILMDKLRLVPILQGGGELEHEKPQYRVFGVEPKSAYYLLGMRNADVLVAASEYVIYNPGRFKAYVKYLTNEKTASLEVRRDGGTVLLKQTFTE